MDNESWNETLDVTEGEIPAAFSGRDYIPSISSIDTALTLDHIPVKGYDFFKTVWLLQRYFAEKYTGSDTASPHNNSVKKRIDADYLRLRPNIALAHPGSDIEDLALLVPTNQRPEAYQLTVNFLGLYGVDSPLPDFYLDELIQADESEDAQRVFLDVFHHRIISLFYQSWSKYQSLFQYFSSDDLGNNNASDTANSIIHGLYSFLGLGDDSKRASLGVATEHLLPFLNRLSPLNRTASTIEIVLKKLLGVEVAIEEFVHRSVLVPVQQQLALGQANCSLNCDMIVGEYVADIAGKVRIHLQDLTWEQYHYFMPLAEGHCLLRDLLNYLLPSPLEYDIQLNLALEQVRSFSLSDDSSIQLGCSTWLAPPDAAAEYSFLSPS